jgi:hypothetical protein
MRRADLDHQPLGSLAGRGRRGRGKADQPGRHDRTVRIWDPNVATCLLTLPLHHEGLAIAAAGDFVAIGLDAGILVIELSPALHPI